jgi:hypothetical protein
MGVVSRIAAGEPGLGLAVRPALGLIASVAGGLPQPASPHPVVPEFPHLAPAGHDDIPALADMLGLREHPASSGS